MSQAENAAIEVTDVDSAANEIERRMTESENVTEDVTEEIESSEEPTEDESSEDSSESEEQESETKEPEEDTPETFETVSELADALEMPLEDFLANIKSTVKINGEEQEVSLNDLKNGYQMESDYRRKTSELAEQRKTLEQQTEQSNAQIRNKLQEVDMLSTNLENQLIEEFNNINWNQLEVEDREEWLVQRQKFGERQQRIGEIKQKAQSEIEQYNQQFQAQQQEAERAHLAKENEALLVAIPEWNDPAIRDTETKNMTNFLIDSGFTEYEASNIQDHRIVKLIRDAYNRQGMTEKVDIAKKKVKTLPKIVKPGNKQNKQDIAAKERKSKLERYKKTGSTDDLAAALLDRM